MHQHEPVTRPKRRTRDTNQKHDWWQMVDPRPVITSRHIVRCVALECALTYREAQALVSAIFEVMAEEIVEGRSVKLGRFGQITVIMRGGRQSGGKKAPPSAHMRLKIDHRQKSYVNALAEEMGKEIAGLAVENIDGFPVVRIDPEIYPRLGVFNPGMQDNISTPRGRFSLWMLRSALKRQEDKAKKRLGIEDDPIEKQREAVARDLFYHTTKRPQRRGFRALPFRFLNGERPKEIQEMFDRHEAHDPDGRFRSQARRGRRSTEPPETTE